MSISEIVERLGRIIIKANGLLEKLPKGTVDKRWVYNKAKRKYWYYYLKVDGRSIYLGPEDFGLTGLAIERREIRHRLVRIRSTARNMIKNLAAYADQAEELVEAMEDELEELQEQVNELCKKWQEALQVAKLIVMRGERRRRWRKLK